MKWPTHETADLISKGVLEIGDGYRAKNSEMAEEGVPFIRAGDVAGRVNTIGTDLLSYTSVSKVGRKRSITGDVVMTTKGTIGRLAFVQEGDPEFIYSPQLCFWRSLDPNTIDQRWLFFAMRSQEMLDQISWSAGQTDMAPYVSLTDQRTAFKLTLPPIKEQREIAAILGALDDKIELNRKTAATLEEMARALYRSWFVDFDPVWAKLEGRTPAHMDAATAALFPDRFDEEGLPEGWARAGFLELVEIISGGTPKTSEQLYWNGDIPWYSVVDAPGAGQIFVLDTEKKITEAGFESCSAKRIGKGTTIISARGTVGKIALAPSDMVFNQSCYGLHAKGKAAPSFVYFATVRAVEQLQSMAHGSVFSTITRKTFEGLELVSAPKAINSAFEVETGRFLERVLQLGRENQTLSILRDTLLPRLMSGELRVGEAREQVEGVA